ncbi:hypothetical protein GCM10010873_06250 [Cypionkella aquatica]|uniref:DUF2339 domain-containing protein n=1 Tax=Cypionkella aquatica TaxID=1756042 RepID=A0AA37WYY3_9RHOB|nr:DUF2339 domain-containing protein [Cypionkella aquatica]GLS85652.1 hypothetical protein GCM10010873_06250 [Cypionkella aquatica]
MDGLLVLLGLVALAIPVAIVALLIGQAGLRRRVAELEQQLASHAARLQDMVDGAAGMPMVPTQPTRVIAEPQQSDVVLAEPAAVDAATADISAVVPQPTRPLTPWERATGGAKASEDAAAGVSAPVAAPKPAAGPSAVARLAEWLKANWVYAISAASLALAGVFFVQYGIENGLLPPGLRVLCGIAFGLCLIGAGEWLRRRSGDSEEVATAYLPSVFAGAGLVSMFAAVLSARLMYGLIGPQMAFVGHVATAVLALVLGWFYGPLLIAVGLLGAFAAPFVVNGGSGAAPWLYAYFAVIAALGLGVDTLRRWAWVSVLALVLGYAGGWLSMMAGAGVAGWVCLLLALAMMAVAIPERGLVPRQAGPSLLLAGLGSVRPPFPVLLAGGAALASALGLVLLAGAASGEAMLAFGGLTVMALAYVVWAEKAEGLADLGVIPAVGFWLMLAQIGSSHMPLKWDFLAAANRGAEVAAPLTISWLVGMAALISAAFAWRSRQEGVLALIQGAAAALVAPVVVAILALLWLPEVVIGAYPWALHVMAVAAGMVVLAVMFARGEDRRRPAYATLSALSLIALALFLVTTNTALTLALALLALVAAELDRRFKLPEMGWFIQAAVAVLGYRLLADPGLDWAFEAPLTQVLLAFVGVIAALVAAWRILPEGRVLPKGVLESAAAGLAAILANILITRWVLPEGAFGNYDTYWSISLNGLPWLVLMLMQIYRARLGGVLLRLRQAIAVVAGGLTLGALALAVGPFNPLFSSYAEDPGALVLGPMVLDTLLLAYGVPGLILLAAVWKLPGLGRRLQLGFLVVGLALLALYVGLEIRRFWQGDWLGAYGMKQGELYSYTLALMLLGAGLLYQAIARRSGSLRRVAMAVIGLTIAKVFLLDAAGLTGLTRVVSFLGLGLCLAGLAWLNRWAGEVSTQKRDT